MNLALVSRFYWREGAIPNIARTSVKYLQKNGVQCMVFASDVRQQEVHPDVICVRIPLLKIKVLDIAGILFGLALIPKMIYLHKKKRIDGIICHDTSSFYGLYLLSKICRIPAVVFFHGWIYNPVRERAYRRSVSLMYKLNARFCSRYADSIGCVSEEIAEGMRWLGASEEQLLVIFNSVDLERFMRQELNKIKNQTRTVLFVGRLAGEKGVEYLMQATPEIVAKTQNVIIKIIGSGSLEKSLKILAQKLGVDDVVVFCGKVHHNQLCEEYSEADIVVVPSLSEGHALVPIEALACGTPVIGTRIDGIVESVVDGYNGLLVEPRDHKALASAIVNVLSEDSFLKELSDNARQSVKKFSWEEAINKLVSHLQRKQ